MGGSGITAERMDRWVGLVLLHGLVGESSIAAERMDCWW